MKGAVQGLPLQSISKVAINWYARFRAMILVIKNEAPFKSFIFYTLRFDAHNTWLGYCITDTLCPVGQDSFYKLKTTIVPRITKIVITKHPEGKHWSLNNCWSKLRLVKFTAEPTFTRSLRIMSWHDGRKGALFVLNILPITLKLLDLHWILKDSTEGICWQKEYGMCICLRWRSVFILLEVSLRPKAQFLLHVLLPLSCWLPLSYASPTYFLADFLVNL